MQRVFAIGLNKTGTTSLARALRILGYDALHESREVEAAMREAHEQGVPLLSAAPAHDAYLDIRAVERWFDVLDEQYPGSRFILTVRDLEGWLDSREKHVLRNQVRARTGEYDGDWLTVDRDAWVQEWHDHLARVRAHFAGRDDLLEMDITAGHGWERLAPFLGQPIPEEPFPWLHRAEARTPLERAKRRVKRLLGRDPVTRP